MRKYYILEIETDRELWFTKNMFCSLKEAVKVFENEDVNQLAKNSKVVLGDSLGNIISEKSN